jgi:hypothetical protein
LEAAFALVLIQILQSGCQCFGIFFGGSWCLSGYSKRSRPV